MRELALDELLDQFEDAYDLDVPLKLRPFMAKLQTKAVEELRQRLAHRVATNFARDWPIESMKKNRQSPSGPRAVRRRPCPSRVQIVQGLCFAIFAKTQFNN